MIQDCKTRNLNGKPVAAPSPRRHVDISKQDNGFAEPKAPFNPAPPAPTQADTIKRPPYLRLVKSDE